MGCCTDVREIQLVKFDHERRLSLTCRYIDSESNVVLG
jgi:hypothetical protein